jgi:hypothetical protein
VKDEKPIRKRLKEAVLSKGGPCNDEFGGKEGIKEE